MMTVPMRVLGLGVVAPDIAEARLNYNHNLEFDQPKASTTDDFMTDQVRLKKKKETAV
jgi:hypothetical protein